MKTFTLLQLAVASNAFVLPDTDVFNELQTQSQHVINSISDDFPEKGTVIDKIASVTEDAAHDVERVGGHWYNRISSSLEDAVDYATEAANQAKHKVHDTYFDAEGWLFSAKHQAKGSFDEVASSLEDAHAKVQHHASSDHHKPNLTVYELITKSNYTTKLAKLVNEYPDIVEALNSTTANYTVFAPTDYAFSKIPKHAPKPSKEQLKALLEYHISSDFYPAGRVLVTRTIPTLLKSAELGDEPLPQRLSTSIGFQGLLVNFYSRVVAVNIFGTNGVIHGVDSIILPPPETLKIIELLPSEFSTLELGLLKTGLDKTINETHNGGTFFAPSNSAFSHLGPRINAFLFSKYGEKYLKALLEYHVVKKQTLYSDAFYGSSSKDDYGSVPKGRYHVELPTLLEDKSLSIDIIRYGRLIEIKINAFSRVTVSDGVAKDGVIHGLSNVLIPPKQLANGKLDMWDGQSDLTLEDFMERFEPFVGREDL